MADAVKAAYEELRLTGFVPVNGRSLEGQALYRRALEILRQGNRGQSSSSEETPEPASKRRRPSTDGKDRASEALADAAGKEGKFLAMLAGFSQRMAEDFSRAERRAAEAVAAAVGGERAALRGVTSELERSVQGFLQGLLGALPPGDTSSEATAQAAAALSADLAAGRSGALPALSSTNPAALAAALPAVVSELLACREALGQEVKALRAQVLREGEVAVQLQQQRDELSHELQVVRDELAAASQDLELARKALSELQEGQARRRTELARRAGKAVEVALMAELEVLGGHMERGLSPARDRLEGGGVSLSAAGAALGAAEAAVRAGAEALAGEAEARQEQVHELCERLRAAEERAARAASAAEAAGGRSAEALLAAAEGLRGAGAARGAAEAARERLDEQLRQYGAGHCAALGELHELVREGVMRGPLALFKEFRAPEREPLTPEKCSAGSQQREASRCISRLSGLTQFGGDPTEITKASENGISCSSQGMPSSSSASVYSA